MDNKQPKERLRSFFKFFLDDTCAHRLKIPSAFTSYMQGNLSRRASLRNRDGSTWPVKVTRIENDFFFLDGWTKYVADNAVVQGDFLVFQYDGNSVYDVIILAPNMCEKKGFSALIPKEEEGEEENDTNANEIHMGTQCIRPKEEEVEEEDEENDEVEEDEEEEQLEEEEKNEIDSVENESCNIATEIDMDGDSVPEEDTEEVEDEEEVEEEEQKSEERVELVVESKSSKKAKKDGNGECKRQVDPYGSYIFRSGILPQPKNPYFITKIRKKRRDELYVPVDTIRDHNLTLPPMIKLVDQQGREWTSTLTPWKDGRLWYYGGWAKLCRVNLVQLDDTCICEFKKRNGDELFIEVHILSAKITSEV